MGSLGRPVGLRDIWIISFPTKPATVLIEAQSGEVSVNKYSPEPDSVLKNYKWRFLRGLFTASALLKNTILVAWLWGFRDAQNTLSLLVSWC